MKVIIAGSRDDITAAHVDKAIYLAGFTITEVVCGTARGADTFGAMWANYNRIPVKRMPADWNGAGKRAGYLRNVDMANYADALIAVWNGKSNGTAHMVNIMRERGKPVFMLQLGERPYPEPNFRLCVITPE